MPLTFLLDEHLRGPLWRAIQRHNASGGLPIDALRVGDPADLPLGSVDPAVLAWAERKDRILLTLDRDTMANHLSDHLQAGRHSPGVFILDGSCSLTTLVGYLELVAHAGDPADYRDQITFVP